MITIKYKPECVLLLAISIINTISVISLVTNKSSSQNEFSYTAESNLSLPKSAVTVTTSSIQCDNSSLIYEDESSLLDSDTNIETTITYSLPEEIIPDNTNSTESIVDSSEAEDVTSETNSVTSLNVPDGETDFYAYMSYKCITDTSSDQYKLQQTAWTDWQGIRRVGDDVCVALGSYYGTEIGTRYIITTDNGNCYTAVLADCKADCHTDDMNQYRLAGGEKKNVVEFLVDTSALDSSISVSGNVGTYENYSGNILTIERID